MSATHAKLRLPKDGLLRVNPVGIELRAAGAAGGPVMTGHFVVFDEWTEIKTYYEGNFLEKFAPGSIRKTIVDNRSAMRALFQHGFDPSIGDKPLGPIDVLEEDGEGGYYEVPLLDAGYVRDDVLPGLEAKLYGCSFRFRVVREELDEEPGISDDNPNGLPERIVKECVVAEFGPVTFPAYQGASAGLRSLRPGDLVWALAEDPHSHLADDRRAAKPSSEESTEVEETEVEETETPEVEETEVEQDAQREQAPPEDSAEAEPHPVDGRRKKQPPFGGTSKRTPPWRDNATPKPPWASGS